MWVYAQAQNPLQSSILYQCHDPPSSARLYAESWEGTGVPLPLPMAVASAVNLRHLFLLWQSRESPMAQSRCVPTARAHRCSSVGLELSRQEGDFPLTLQPLIWPLKQWGWFTSKVARLVGQRMVLFSKRPERTTRSSAFRITILMFTGHYGSPLLP